MVARASHDVPGILAALEIVQEQVRSTLISATQPLARYPNVEFVVLVVYPY
jgi:hypothetical protein